MMDRIVNKSSSINSFEWVCNFLKIKNLRLNTVGHTHFKNIMADSILHVLKLSNETVIGIARKNGIERTKNIVAFSREEKRTYITKAPTRYGTTARGKTPVTIKPNKISSITKTQLSIFLFIFINCPR